MKDLGLNNPAFDQFALSHLLTEGNAMNEHSPQTRRPLFLAHEILVVVIGFAAYLGLRSYQNIIATGQAQAALSLAKWAFGAESKMHSVLLMNLLLDVPFAIMSGVLIAAILMALKPRALLLSGIIVAVLSEAAWLFIGDTLTSGWLAVSRMIAALGLIVGCFWLQRFWKYPLAEASTDKNTRTQP